MYLYIISTKGAGIYGKYSVQGSSRKRSEIPLFLNAIFIAFHRYMADTGELGQVFKRPRRSFLVVSSVTELSRVLQQVLHQQLLRMLFRGTSNFKICPLSFALSSVNLSDFTLACCHHILTQLTTVIRFVHRLTVLKS